MKKTMKRIGRLLATAGLMMAAALAAPAWAQDEDLPNVVVLATGGTIAGSAAAETATRGYEIERGVQELIDAVPDLVKIADLTGEQVYNVGSPSVTDVERIVLTKRINELLAQDDVDGIVVTHGTETLEQTAYFLNLAVKSDKPVVVVGAMRPASAISADGPMNLYNAVMVAGTEEARGKGVLIMMNDRIGAARYINKTSGWAVDTFDSLEQGYLGEVMGGVVRFNQASTKLHTTGTELDVSDVESLPEVHILYGAYGPTSAALIDAAVADGAKGLILAGTIGGEGGDRLEELHKSGEVVVVRSFWQASGLRGDDSNYVAGNSISPLKARVLLQMALKDTSDPETIQRYFNEY